MKLNPNNFKLKIGENALERIGLDCKDKYFKFVGLRFDEFLTWEYQVDHISRKLASGNFAINSTKKLLPKKVKMLIYNSLVKSHLEYGIVAWGGANQKLLKKTK